MQIRNRRIKAAKAYDIWDEPIAASKVEPKASKIHPSKKRTKQITLPHPGQSYNPDPDDHARLLKRIAQKELEYQKEQTAINRSLHLQSKVDAKEVRKHDEQELLSGLEHLIKKDAVVESDDDESVSIHSDYDEKDFEAILKDKAVEEKRKTNRQRLGQLRDKLQRRAAKLRKLKNIRLSKFDAIKKITKELDKKQKEATAKQTRKHRKTRDERLGPKFEPSDPIYCLRSELPSNLREVSCPMNAIVREQLESFQKRLLVEPSKPQIKTRKYPKKQFERMCTDERVR